MNSIWHIALKSLSSIAALFVLTRLMGKKQISQFTFFDYVVGISIGAIAGAFAITDTIGYGRGMTALVVFALFPIMLSFISQQSYRGREILNGRPTVLVENGRILERNLRRSKFSVNDLLEECRLKNAYNIADVRTAVLETSGKVSIQLKPRNQPLTPKDVHLKSARNGLCTNLIIDGTVLWDHLQQLGKDDDWLYRQLRGQRVGDVDDVLLAYVDSADKLNVYTKNSDRAISPLM